MMNLKVYPQFCSAILDDENFWTCLDDVVLFNFSHFFLLLLLFKNKVRKKN